MAIVSWPCPWGAQCDAVQWQSEAAEAHLREGNQPVGVFVVAFSPGPAPEAKAQTSPSSGSEATATSGPRGEVVSGETALGSRPQPSWGSSEGDPEAETT